MLKLTTAEIATLNEVSKISNIPIKIEHNKEYGMHSVSFGEGYKVVYTNKNKEEFWCIVCSHNDNCIGLTWNDGESMNGKEVS